MRDKYIELIREYIKVKPEYKYVLRELKKDLTMVGATEEEFNEALKQIMGLMKASHSQSQNHNQARIKKYKRKLKLFLQSAKEKSELFLNFSKYHAIRKKEWIAVASFVVIIFIFVQFLSVNQKIQISTATPDFPVQAQITRQNLISFMYASQKPVDPEKIFSIKSEEPQPVTDKKPKKEVMGFFPYWMLPKQDQINLSALTSISLFGLEIDDKGDVVTSANGNIDSGWAMWENSNLNDLIKRAKSKDIKVYLTLKSFDNGNIEALSTDEKAQENLIQNALYLVNSKNLDGINIDFEYTNNASDKVRNGFTKLITNLNSELKRQIPTSKLTIDTYLVSGSEKDLFDIPALAQSSDDFVIMAYDMHTPLGNPGPVSAMGGVTNIISYVKGYLKQTDANKLILAVPYYGYDWPDTQASTSADMVKILPFAQIAEASQNLKLSWDETSQTPYFIYKDALGNPRIVHFDNVRSLGIKYDYINSENLAGAGIWALGYDGQNPDLEKLLIDKFVNK